jgi:flagellar motility protein MotE (MotC chaperone)
MKKLLPYIIVFVVSTVATTAVAVLYVVLRPPVDAVPATADSVAAKPAVGPLYGPTLQELQAKDTATVVAGAPPGADSTTVLQLALQDERKKSAHLAEQLRAVMDSSRKAIAVADSTQQEQRKSMAKVLENMDPTSAARILSDFPDGDVKTCLLTMKKRQAAKILAALQPDRAARIMR